MPSGMEPYWYYAQLFKENAELYKLFSKESGFTPYTFQQAQTPLLWEAECDWVDLSKQQPKAIILSKGKLKNEFKTLTDTDDIIVFETKKRLDDDEKNLIEKRFKLLHGTSCLVLFLVKGESIQKLSEEDMRKRGWQRIKKEKPVKIGDIEPRKLDL